MNSDDESDGVYLIVADDNEDDVNVLNMNSDDLNEYIVQLCDKTTVKEEIEEQDEVEEDESTTNDVAVPLNYEEEDTSFPCKYCDTILNDKSDMKGHCELVHKIKWLQCKYCEKNFMDSDILAKHEMLCCVKLPDRTVKKGLKYTKVKCPKCQKLIVRKQLSKHLRTHDPPAYSCDQCTARFKDKIAFESHYNAHAGVRPYICEYCTNTYTSRTALYRHKRYHTGITYTCEFCSKEFKRSDTYTKHLRKHTDPPQEFLCGDCGKKFKEQKSFLAHRMIHQSGKPHKCQYCNKCFLRLFDLKTHMQKKHNYVLITKKYYYNMMAKNASMGLSNYVLPCPEEQAEFEVVIKDEIE